MKYFMLLCEKFCLFTGYEQTEDTEAVQSCSYF